MSEWKSAFDARTDLSKFGDNALGLFALALRYGLDDLESVAASSLTDGPNDKKCDFIFVDKDEGVSVIMQCYLSADTTKLKKGAPSNKAADLNTAAGWVLQRNIDDVPIGIRSAVQELRGGLQDGSIRQLSFWYVHNLPESKNVQDELETVHNTVNSAFSSHSDYQKPEVFVMEVGQSKLREWYEDTQSPILVTDEFKIAISSGFVIQSEGWEAFVTAIPAEFLRKTYRDTKYKERLFSANVRDFLGMRKSDSNINFGIKSAAEKDPSSFWAFNNGVTVLTNSFEEIHLKKTRTLKVRGMSIVNGAQTTGALGSISKRLRRDVLVPARFIKTSNSEIIHGIIQFNNSQNKITASDFRSTDSIQKRLRDEVSKMSNADYEGGRRGGYSEAIKRKPNLLPSYTVGQSLAALHQDPITAYNSKSDIWADDATYAKFFNDKTTGRHLVFAYSLVRAIETTKLDLFRKKGVDSDLTEIQEAQVAFFRNKGAIYLLAAAISSCLETILGKRISDLFHLSFSEKTTPKDAQKEWAQIVEVLLPLCSQLNDAFTAGLKSPQRIKDSIDKFRSLAQATVLSNKKIYETFSKKVQLKRR